MDENKCQFCTIVGSDPHMVSWIWIKMFHKTEESDYIWCHGYGSKCFIKQRKVTTYGVMDMDQNVS